MQLYFKTDSITSVFRVNFTKSFKNTFVTVHVPTTGSPLPFKVLNQAPTLQNGQAHSNLSVFGYFVGLGLKGLMKVRG